MYFSLKSSAPFESATLRHLLHWCVSLDLCDLNPQTYSGKYATITAAVHNCVVFFLVSPHLQLIYHNRFSTLMPVDLSKFPVWKCQTSAPAQSYSSSSFFCSADRYPSAAWQPPHGVHGGSVSLCRPPTSQAWKSAHLCVEVKMESQWSREKDQ